MKLKGIFTDRSPLFQLFILLVIIAAGAILSSLISLGIFYSAYGLNANITQHPGALRFYQLFSAIGSFLLPALGAAYLFSDEPKKYLSIGKIPSWQVLLWVLLGMLLLSPVINLSEIINKQFTFPTFLKPLEDWMIAQEENAQEITRLLLSGEGILILIANLIVVAVAAGVTEEFLFRGALQRITGKWLRNPHAVIWIVAFIFSAFHLQFYGLIPRTLLGAFFGYLLYWSKNIWIPVFAHFSNNAFAVIALSTTELKDNEWVTGEIPQEWIWQYSGYAMLSLFLFTIWIRKFRKYLKRERS